MDVAQVRALAAELETTLGLLSELVFELQSRREECTRSGRVQELVARLAARPDLAQLPTVMLRAHAEITEILGGIRLTRAAIEAHAVERIRDTQERLTDVTSTTESATLELMNGLDRTIELVNSLEQQANSRTTGAGFQQLRDQVSALYNHLQFQDITAQQLQGVTHSLLELEVRVAAVAALFDKDMGEGVRGDLLRRALDAGSSATLAFNPDATMSRSVADQQMIDQAFKGARNGHADASGRAGGR
jgi:chemotaxis regulatin CheY-phosphate phosphatase CheZ